MLGLNGAGKSTLLKILAGVDKDFQGETVLTPGHTIGYLEQDPLVDVQKTVREVVEEAVADTVALLAEFEEINAAFAEPMLRFTKTAPFSAQEVTVTREGQVGGGLENLVGPLEQVAFGDGINADIIPARLVDDHGSEL